MEQLYAVHEETYDKSFDWQLWKKLFRYMSPYKRAVWILCLSNVGLAMGNVLFPLMTRYAIDNYIGAETTEGIVLFVVAFVMLAAFQGWTSWLFIKKAGFLEVHICHDIRVKGFKRLQELSFSFYDKTSAGYIMARMTGDVQRLSDVLAWALVDILWAAAVIFGVSGAMLMLNVKIALYVLAVIPVLAVMTIVFQKHILKQQRLVRRTNSRITSAFSEGIMGAKTTKTLVREEQNLEEFNHLTGTMRQASIRAALLNSLFMPLIMLISSIGGAMVLWQGGILVREGLLWFGTLTAFVSYTMQFFEPLMQLARIFAELQQAQASAERVLTLIETEPEIVDSDEIVEKEGDVFHAKKENWKDIVGKVEFKDVSFHYTDNEDVLKHFNLTVEPGQTVALVGETGSGKSTIVNLMCRFYQPTEGQILIDGEDYREHAQIWLQSNLGYVLQSPHLFSGTVAENIAFGMPDASRERVEAAAKAVCADAFIQKLEDGYDTQVGEGGNRLSTGEKQLISFARAIVADPPLFVLDEATSSIDTETELLIQQAITNSLSGRTSFIIAHRLSTIRSADIIVVLRHGVVIEQGTHDELMANGGYYYSLYTNQFLQERDITEVFNKEPEGGCTV
ncbi:ABC transporter ATP-binding protein/permease [Eubacteriales bacterium OttesenSCG-928-N14]|nr:ABC transporter ATP-binding protein/permease [Eubacteriales bacterium OttesenSCG-928-N14]